MAERSEREWRRGFCCSPRISSAWAPCEAAAAGGWRRSLRQAAAAFECERRSVESDGRRIREGAGCGDFEAAGGGVGLVGRPEEATGGGSPWLHFTGAEVGIRWPVRVDADETQP